MKPIESHECEVHVLVCTNERPGPRASCKPLGGQEFYDKLKMKLKDSGKYDTHWITRTGCLGFCNAVGTTVTIHRRGEESVWYNEVKAEDFDTIWNEIMRK